VAKEYEGPVLSPEKPRKLLFITGNRYESKILSIGLEKRGYIITYASTASQLAEMISDEHQLPDSIIYMDDSEEIKPDFVSDLFNNFKINIPVILITDDEHYLSREKFLNSGMAKQVLTKPVSLREIDSAIQVSLV
jgi:DNA-binding response OmpR family regulator